MAIVLIFNLIAILTLFPAIMAIDLRRQRANRMDILCCVKWSNVGDTVVPQNSGYGATAPQMDNGYEMEKRAAAKNGVTSPTSPPVPVPQKKSAYKKFTLTHFVRDWYAPVIQNVWVKVSALEKNCQQQIL